MKDFQALAEETELVSVIEAQQMIGEGAHPVDLRTRAVFSAGHIPGAINLPMDDLIAGGGREMGPVIHYCQAGVLVRRHAVLLRRIFGDENFFALAYGYDEWSVYGLPVAVLPAR